MRVTLLFVCQPGHLELQGRLLVSSLADCLPEGISVFAAVPEGEALSSNTQRLFDERGVFVERFEPETHRRFNYPIGNKVDATAQLQRGDYTLFLDTDMIACRQIAFEPVLAGDIFAVRIFGPRIFGEANLPLFRAFSEEYGASWRFRITTEDEHPPRIVEAFNAGLVGVRTGAGVAEQWRDLSQAVLRSKVLPEEFKDPLADQVALSCMRADDRYDFRVLDSEWNNWRFDPGVPPIFFHYFRTLLLMSHEVLLDRLKRWDKRCDSEDVRLLGEIRLHDISYLFESEAARANRVKDVKAS